MFVKNFSKFIKYYGKGRKIKLFCFFIFSILAGILEALGVALIFPFVLLITNPQVVINSKYYSVFTSHLHVNNVVLSAFLLAGAIATIFVLKNLFMICNLYAQNRFINNWKLDINKKFMHYYLFSPYKDSLKIQPSEKIYNINFLVSQTLDGFVFRVINWGTDAAIVVMILALLFFKFFFAAIVTSIFVFFSLSFQSDFFKKKIAEISQEFFKDSVATNEKTIENINNLKEIKISSAEDYFYTEYASKQCGYVKVFAKNSFYKMTPRYVIEIFVVVSLFIMLGLIFLQNIQDVASMIASFALVVVAIFRIAPALARIQSAKSGINSSKDFVKTMFVEYEKSDFNFMEEKFDLKVNLKDSIKLKNVCFSYAKEPVIRNLDLEIKQGEFVGIVGLTGAGKRTLLNILIGLLPINSGEIFVDETKFNQANYSALRKLVGYLSPQISVLNKSFKANVAWGVNEEEIDEEKVVESLKRAQLYLFVSGKEGGINAKIQQESLTQGQKQRLALARAFYRDVEILMIDETTVSIGAEGELEIIKMLSELKGEKTIIVNAQKLSTIKNCDRLIYLKKGKLIDIGGYDELSSKYEDFEKLINLKKVF